MLREGDILYNIYDEHTGEWVTYSKVTDWIDGTPMDDAHCDGVIFRKEDGEYFKRNYSGPINPLWFGADPTGALDSTPAFQAAIDAFQTGGLDSGVDILIPRGTYLLGDLIIKTGTKLYANQSSKDNSASNVPVTIKPFGNPNYVIDCDSTASNWAIENLYIDCDYTNQPQLIAGIRTRGTKALLIGNNINNAPGHAVLNAAGLIFIEKNSILGMFSPNYTFTGLNDFKGALHMDSIGDSYVYDNEISASLPYFTSTVIPRDPTNGRIVAMSFGGIFSGTSVVSGNLFENGDRAVAIGNSLYCNFHNNRYELSAIGGLYIYGPLQFATFSQERFADNSLSVDGGADDITIATGAAGNIVFSVPTFESLVNGAIPNSNFKVNYHISNYGSDLVDLVTPSVDPTYSVNGLINLSDITNLPVRQVKGQYDPDNPQFDSVSTQKLPAETPQVGYIKLKQGTDSLNGSFVGAAEFWTPQNTIAYSIGFSPKEYLSITGYEPTPLVAFNSDITIQKNGEAKCTIWSLDGLGDAKVVLQGFGNVSNQSIIQMNNSTNNLDITSSGDITIGVNQNFKFQNNGLTLIPFNPSSGVLNSSQVLIRDTSTGELQITDPGSFLITASNGLSYSLGNVTLGGTFDSNILISNTVDNKNFQIKTEADGDPTQYSQYSQNRGGITLASSSPSGISQAQLLLLNNAINLNITDSGNGISFFANNSSILRNALTIGETNGALSSFYHTNSSGIVTAGIQLNDSGINIISPLNTSTSGYSLLTINPSNVIEIIDPGTGFIQNQILVSQNAGYYINQPSKIEYLTDTDGNAFGALEVYRTILNPIAKAPQNIRSVFRVYSTESGHEDKELTSVYGGLHITSSNTGNYTNGTEGLIAVAGTASTLGGSGNITLMSCFGALGGNAPTGSMTIDRFAFFKVTSYDQNANTGKVTKIAGFAQPKLSIPGATGAIQWFSGMGDATTSGGMLGNQTWPTGNWNMYDASTYSNYFSGTILASTLTDDTTSKLQVGGTTRTSKVVGGTVITDTLSLQNYTSGTTGAVIDQYGVTIGGGSASAFTLCKLIRTFTDPTGNVHGFRAENTAAYTTASTANAMFGGFFIPTISAANTQNWTSATAIQGISVAPTITSGATGTIGGIIAATFDLNLRAAGVTVTNAMGIRVYVDPLTTSTLTNLTLLGIGTSTTVSGNWAIHNLANFPNYLGPNTTYINTTTDSGSGAKLQVNGTIEGTGGRFVSTTTPQVRVAYDASNFMTISTSSAGAVTFAISGTSPAFTFSRLSNFSSGITINNTSSNIYLGNAFLPSASSNALYLFGGVGTTDVRTGLGGDTTATISTNGSYSSVVVGKAPITAASSGTHPVITSLGVIAPAITTGASTITDAATIYIDDAPTAGTNNYAILAKSGNIRATSGRFIVGTANIISGTGSPETVVTAPVGSLFLRTDGGANTTLYVKESGAGNTGWIAK